jgi:sugar lactone lactonase YvrE
MTTIRTLLPALPLPPRVATAMTPTVALAAAGLVLAAVLGMGAAPAVAQPPAAGTISTVAGSAGGPAKATKVAVSSCGLAYRGGQVRIADGTTVRTVNARTDWLTTAAGNDAAGPLGDGGPASAASLGSACGVAVDHAGNLVIADAAGFRIRVVAHTTATFYGRAMTAGDIYTIAGDGTQAFSGDGGPATEAGLQAPYAVAVDKVGNLVLTDGDRVRAVAAQTGFFYGKAMTAGDIYTVAGTGQAGFSGDGLRATRAKLWDPQGVSLDPAGNLLIADTFNTRIRVVAHRSGTFYGQAMTAGDIYTIAGSGDHGLGNGGPAVGAELISPHGMAVDAAGNLLIANSGDDMVRVVAASTGEFYGQAMTAGDIYTIAGNGTGVFRGNGGPATAAGVGSPQGVAVDGAGNVLIAAEGISRTLVVPVTTGTFYGQAMTAGDIYTIAGDGSPTFSGDGAAATAAQFSVPDGVAVDGAGNFVIADTGNNRIRVLARSTGEFYGQPMTAGDIYTVAGHGRKGAFGDGGPATAAVLGQPAGVTVDTAGNLVVADTGTNRIRVVAAGTGEFYGQPMTAGDIYTVAGTGQPGSTGDGGPATAARLDLPRAVTFDGAGNLVIADTGSNRIRVVAAGTGKFYGQPMTAGDIYTVAGDGTMGFSGDGGPATVAALGIPEGVSVDPAGNLLIADSFNNRVRVVAAKTGTFYRRAMTAGDIYTVAGDGTQGFAGDGGPATAAEIYAPVGVLRDGAGNLVFTDAGNNRVRVVAESTGTFYGKAMTAGNIYTIAGTGTAEFTGDGGPAAAAGLAGPTGIAEVGGTGGLAVADASNNRVRQIAP